MDYGVPLPRGLALKEPRQQYPFKLMELKDSFLVPGFESQEAKMRARVLSAVTTQRSRGVLPKTFRIVMAWENGLRIWRIS